MFEEATRNFMDCPVPSNGSLSSPLQLWCQTAVVVCVINDTLVSTFPAGGGNYSYTRFTIQIWNSFTGKMGQVLNMVPAYTVEANEEEVLRFPLEDVCPRNNYNLTEEVFWFPLKNVCLDKSKDYYLTAIQETVITGNHSYKVLNKPLQSEVFKGNCEECLICGVRKKDLNMVYLPSASKLQLEFKPSALFKRCFEKISVHLMKNGPGCCFLNKQQNILRSESANLIDTTQSAVISFMNVSGGNYCAHICPEKREDNPCSKYEEPLCKCSLYTVLEGPNSTHSAYAAKNENNDQQRWVIVVLVTCCVVCVCLTSSIWLWCRLYNKRSMLVVIEEEMKEVRSIPVTKSVQVFLLYSHDSPSHKEVVYNFAQFLKDCFDVSVVLDVEQQHVLCKDQESWLSGMLQYRCAKWTEKDHSVSDPNKERKVIIVESKGAVEQQEMKEKGMVKEDYQYHLEQLFISGLSIITSDLVRSVSDYCHLFVVHFDYTPHSYKFKHIVPNQRFLLPGHLKELYDSIHSSGNGDTSNKFSPSQERLEEQWLRNLTYHKFLDAIKAAATEHPETE